MVDVRLQLDEGPIRVAVSVVDHIPAMFSLFNKRSEERVEASAALAVQAQFRGNAARKRTRRDSMSEADLQPQNAYATELFKEAKASTEPRGAVEKFDE